MARRNSNLGGEQLLLLWPHSDWKRVSELPDLRRVETIALDRETNDLGLQNNIGPGWTRGMGTILGTSVAWREGNEVRAVYLPVWHPMSENFDEKQVAQWERDLQKAGVRFVMQNAGYDVGYGAACWSLPVPEKIDDTSAMAYMIDEQRQSYSLDALCSWRGLPGKDERLLRETAMLLGVDVKGSMFKMPAKYVGGYAEQDAIMTLLLYESLLPEIEEKNLRQAYDLEMALVPVVHEMMRRGTRVDLEEADRLYKKFKFESQQALDDLSDRLGTTANIESIRSNDWLTKAFDRCNIEYPLTPKGAPSFRADWMKKTGHWLPGLITKAKSREDAAEKFVKNYIMDYQHNGRLHASVHQYKSQKEGNSDDEGYSGGTRTHRFSYSDPPLQQMPMRDKELAEIRNIFIPEEGEIWLSADVSQQELRLFVHYADMLNLPMAKEAADKYRNDPSTDFHQVVADMAGLQRKPAKDLNFATLYGAGERKFALMSGKTIEEARALMERYDRQIPFAKKLAQHCEQTAQQRGYIKLLDGARIHFDWWVAVWREYGTKWTKENFMSDCRRDEAERRVADPSHSWYRRSLRRSRAHKALNSLIQGGAARQTKAAMRDCAHAGFMPLLQVHDELCFSISVLDDAGKIAELMQNCVPLRVPVLVDAEVGESWGTAKTKWTDYGKAIK